MSNQKNPAMGTKGPDEFINEYENECKCEFIDPRFLVVTALDSEHAALEYFYQSPFYLKYRETVLNEHMRVGKMVDSHQVGLMFQVTYNNLDSIAERLRNMTQVDEPARLQLYSNSAIFHITLFSRTLGQSGLTSTPIKIYYIIQGSIFMCPPFGSLIRMRLHQAVEQFERFYDRLNDISTWSATNGYAWEPKPKPLDPQIEQLCERYNFHESSLVNYEKDGNMNIFYLKPLEASATRIAHDHIRELARKLGEAEDPAVATIAEQNAQVTTSTLQ